MKLTPPFSYFLILFSFCLLTLVSCGVDQELLLDAVLEQEEDSDNPDDGDTSGDTDSEEDLPTPPDIPDVNAEDSLDISTEPCGYDLSSVTSGSTLSIDCTLDLNGASVTLPSNVVLEYNGGQIINGTISFASGQIDYRLLNYELEVEGNVTLIDPVFFFYPGRWDVQQGQVDYDRALANRINIENTINISKTLGATTFQMGVFDGFFEITKVTSPTNHNFYPSVEAINVPSDFTFVMSEDTHLRVFPNSEKKYSLLAVRDANNVNVIGGNLHGDRDQHDYSAGGTQEWGHLLDLHAATNTYVSGVRMEKALGDGLKIHSLNFTFMDTYRPSNNIVVTDCVFVNNRRNNLSITDGYNIVIENSDFLDASNDTAFSEGIAPGFAIDVEAARTRGDDGELIFYEIARDIIIRNNTERNSRKGGFTVAIGYDVTIENNYSESGISYSTANGTRIIGNTVKAVTQEDRDSGVGIKAGRSSSDSPTIYDNKVIGNNVIGFDIGIFAGNDDVEVSGNTVEDFDSGIFPVLLTNAVIKNNTLISSRPQSEGVFVFSTEISDVVFEGNNIQVATNPIKFTAVNEDATTDQNVVIRGNTMDSPSGKLHFNRTNGGVTIENNNLLNHGVEIFSSESLDFVDNQINAVGSFDPGIHIRETNNDIIISDNDITVDNGEECIEIQSSTSRSEVSTTNNQCGN